MPNGVICGGALDGSNQAGEIVTCHAMTARPDGSAATDCGALNAKSARISEPKNPSRKRRICDGVMKPPLRETPPCLMDAGGYGVSAISVVPGNTVRRDAPLGWRLLSPWLSSGARLSAAALLALLRR